MALKFLGIWPNTPDDGSPTIWQDETTGDLIIQSWKADEATGRGVVMRRLRVVSEPLSDYVRYEYGGTFTNVAAGEDVRWLPRARARDLLLPALDGWVMDEETVILHHFSGEGQWTGLRMEVCHDPALAARYVKAYEAAWERAVPHAEYQPA